MPKGIYNRGGSAAATARAPEHVSIRQGERVRYLLQSVVRASREV